jgi:hypothetical protein
MWAFCRYAPPAATPQSRMSSKEKYLWSSPNIQSRHNMHQASKFKEVACRFLSVILLVLWSAVSKRRCTSGSPGWEVEVNWNLILTNQIPVGLRICIMEVFNAKWITMANYTSSHPAPQDPWCLSASGCSLFKCDPLWQKEALGVKSCERVVWYGLILHKIIFKMMYDISNILTIDWDMDLIHPFSQVFGYNYFEKTWSEGEVGPTLSMKSIRNSNIWTNSPLTPANHCRRQACLLHLLS